MSDPAINCFSLKNYRDIPGGDWPILIASFSEEKTLGNLHFHDFFELAIVTSGYGVYHDGEGKRYRLMPGTVFLLRPGMHHQYVEQHHLHVTNLLWLEKELEMPLSSLQSCPGYYALFTLEPAMRSRFNLKHALELSTAQLAEVRNLLRRLQYELTERPAGAILSANCLLILLLTTLCRAYTQKTQDNDELRLMDQVLTYIHSHYQQSIRRSQLAGLIAMSEANFYRLFQRIVDCSPTEYILQVRLKNAEERLRKSTAGLTEIALQCGFSDGNYFGAVFKRYYGITPHQYRLHLSNPINRH